MTDVESSTPADAARPTHHVQSLARGLAVIRSFDEEHPSLTLSEVAKRTGLTRAAARRFLLTLADLGYVAADGQRFSLTPRVLELGYAYLSSLTFPELAQPHLERLASQVNESSSVAVLDGEDIVYVARVATSRIMAVSITVGTRLPAHATSMGRVLLAELAPEDVGTRLGHQQLQAFTERTLTDPDALKGELSRVSDQGFALVDQELETGLRSIAVPIKGRDDRVPAAVNISVQASRWSPEQMRQNLLPALRRTAQAITQDLQAVDADQVLNMPPRR